MRHLLSRQAFFLTLVLVAYFATLQQANLANCPPMTDLKKQLTDEEKALLYEYDWKIMPPPGLIKAYAGFVKATKDPTEEALSAHLLPGAVEITTKERPNLDRQYGQDINLPYLKTGFKAQILVIQKLNDGCYVIATGTSALWFVETKTQGWKIYRYRDKPFE
jgi:hypothetical protein